MGGTRRGGQAFSFFSKVANRNNKTSATSAHMYVREETESVDPHFVLVGKFGVSRTVKKQTKKQILSLHRHQNHQRTKLSTNQDGQIVSNHTLYTDRSTHRINQSSKPNYQANQTKPST
jgi:hypothetical protein